MGCKQLLCCAAYMSQQSFLHHNIARCELAFFNIMKYFLYDFLYEKNNQNLFSVFKHLHLVQLTKKLTVVFNVSQQAKPWWTLKTVVHWHVVASQRKRLSWVQLAGHKGRIVSYHDKFNYKV